MKPANAARALLALRKTKSGGRNGGRPVTLKPCPKCGSLLTLTQLRRHKCT